MLVGACGLGVAIVGATGDIRGDDVDCAARGCDTKDAARFGGRADNIDVGVAGDGKIAAGGDAGSRGILLTTIINLDRSEVDIVARELCRAARGDVRASQRQAAGAGIHLQASTSIYPSAGGNDGLAADVHRLRRKRDAVRGIQVHVAAGKECAAIGLDVGGVDGHAVGRGDRAGIVEAADVHADRVTRNHGAGAVDLRPVRGREIDDRHQHLRTIDGLGLIDHDGLGEGRRLLGRERLAKGKAMRLSIGNTVIEQRLHLIGGVVAGDERTVAQAIADQLAQLRIDELIVEIGVAEEGNLGLRRIADPVDKIPRAIES